MTETSATRRTGVSGGARPAVVAAAVGSAVAGLVHTAAAGTHQGDSLLVWMFSACAAAQLGWGWAVAVAPRLRRSLLLTGLVINGGAVLVWAVSRTVRHQLHQLAQGPRGSWNAGSHVGAVRSAERGGHRVPPRPSRGAGRVSSVVGRSRRGVRVLARDACIGRRAHAPSRSPRSRDHGRRGGRREPQPQPMRRRTITATPTRLPQTQGTGTTTLSVRAPHQRTGTTTGRRRASRHRTRTITLQSRRQHHRTRMTTAPPRRQSRSPTTIRATPPPPRPPRRTIIRRPPRQRPTITIRVRIRDHRSRRSTILASRPSRCKLRST